MDAGELSFEDLTFGDEEQHELKEQDKNVVFVFTSYGGKINVDALLKIVETSCGTLKTNNFREKQCFGFLQFIDNDGVEKALEHLQNIEIDGFPINVEKISRITPGRDPRTHDAKSEFKNSTLVFKNLPFQLKQEKLEEMLGNFEVKPASVSYLYDSSGMFRGMAFVKYKEIGQATKIFETMNNLDINGRKLRIEYKRKVQEADIIPEDNVQKLYDQLATFRTNQTLNELAFPCGTSFQRKQIHQFAEKLGLVHFSTGEGESRYVLVKKKEFDTPPATPPTNTTSPFQQQTISTGTTPITLTTLSGMTPSMIVTSSPTHNATNTIPINMSTTPTNHSKGQPINKSGRKQEYRQRSGSSSFDPKLSPDDRQFYGSPEKPRSFSGTSFGSLKSPPSSLGQSPTYRNSALMLNRGVVELHGHGIQPVRQPKGPDGSNGFAEVYRKTRSKE